MNSRQPFFRSMMAIMLMAVFCTQSASSATNRALFGTPRFEQKAISNDFNSAYSVDGADMDGDGDIDVLGSAAIAGINWWENDGSQNFTEHIISDTFRGAEVQAVDMDGDLDIDVIAASAQDDTIAWWENNGAESFTKRLVDGNIIDAISIFAIDLDEDEDVDVLGAAYYPDQIAWWENDGSENFTRHTISTSFDGAWSVYATDLDGDGDLDVLGAASNGDEIAWWENDGVENFSPHSVTSSFYGAMSVTSIDLDDDGDMDILGAAFTGDEITWWENDGSENFTEHVIAGDFNHARFVAAVDLDQDGDVDVLGAADRAWSPLDDIKWWENDGSENFSEHTISSNFDGARALLALDLDKDTDVDILGAAGDADAIAWWEQLGPFKVYLPFNTYEYISYPPANVREHTTDGDGLVTVPLESGGEAAFRFIDRLAQPVTGLPVHSIENLYGVTLVAAGQGQGFFPTILSAPSALASSNSTQLAQAQDTFLEVPLVPFNPDEMYAEQREILYGHLLSLPENSPSWEKQKATSSEACAILETGENVLSIMSFANLIKKPTVGKLIKKVAFYLGAHVGMSKCENILGIQEHILLENQALQIYIADWDATVSNSYGVIFGQVVDSESNAGIQNAQIDIGLPGVTTITFPNGWYRLESVPAGTNILNAAKPGYYPSSTSVSVSPNRTSLADDIVLELTSYGTWAVYNDTDGLLTVEIYGVGTRSIHEWYWTFWKMPGGTYNFTAWTTACGGTVEDTINILPGETLTNRFYCAPAGAALPALSSEALAP